MKTLSISTKAFLGKIVLGFLMIAIAITNMFDGLIWDIVSILFLVVVAGILTALSKMKSEEDDEMSLFNYKEAKSKVSDIMHLLLLAIAVIVPIILSKIDTSDISLPIIVGSIFYSVVGIQNILTGIIFRKLEAE